MKKNFSILFLLAFLTNSFTLTAQTASLDSDEVVFYGLDFSKTTMAAIDLRAKGGEAIQVGYFEGWNDLLLGERDKYSIHKFFNKDMVRYDFEIIRKRNRERDVDEMIGDNVSEISEEEIIEMIREYQGDEYSEGLGLVFIVESFNKFEEKGIVWVTFFDIATKEVLSTKKKVGAPGGFGIKNYWAGAIFDIMEKWYIDKRNEERDKKRRKKKKKG